MKLELIGLGFTMIRRTMLFVRKSAREFFPVPLRVRVRGDEKIQAPSPLSSPVKGEEVRKESVFVELASLFLTVLIPFLVANTAHAQTAKEKIRVALGSVTVNSSVIPIGKEAGI